MYGGSIAVTASFTLSEVMPGVSRIETIWMNRRISVHLCAGEQAALVDSGFPHTARESVIPALSALGVMPAQLRYLVVTHASADHHGGNAIIRQWAPAVTVLAHALDADAVEGHEYYAAEHIERLREAGFVVGPVDVRDAGFLALQGAETPVNRRVRGGEILELGLGRRAEVFHAPGHTPGHLALFLSPEPVLFAGDAVMGEGVPDVDGRLIMPPHYFEVDWYLATLSQVAALQPDVLLLTHYPVLRGQQVRELLRRSISFVEQCSEALVDTLRDGGRPMMPEEIVTGLRARIGIPEASYQYALLARAHLRWLQAHGVVEHETPGGVRWCTLS